MEKPILRTLLILTGVVTFSISAWSSAPVRCLSLQDAAQQPLCLAVSRSDRPDCSSVANQALQQQCQATQASSF